MADHFRCRNMPETCARRQRQSLGVSEQETRCILISGTSCIDNFGNRFRRDHNRLTITNHNGAFLTSGNGGDRRICLKARDGFVEVSRLIERKEFLFIGKENINMVLHKMQEAFTVAVDTEAVRQRQRDEATGGFRNLGCVNKRGLGVVLVEKITFKIEDLPRPDHILVNIILREQDRCTKERVHAPCAVVIDEDDAASGSRSAVQRMRRKGHPRARQFRTELSPQIVIRGFADVSCAAAKARNASYRVRAAATRCDDRVLRLSGQRVSAGLIDQIHRILLDAPLLKKSVICAREDVNDRIAQTDNVKTGGSHDYLALVFQTADCQTRQMDATTSHAKRARMKIAYLASRVTLPGSDIRRSDAFEHDYMMNALVPAFAAQGMTLIDISWDDEVADWASFDAAVIGTTWDYWDRMDEFLATLERIGQQTRLFNPPELVRWNIRKTYLRHLEAKGAELIPTLWLDSVTRKDVESAFDLLESDDLVFKRQVGAGAKDQHRLTRGGPVPDMPHAMMAQPFMKMIQDEGEISFIFIDGEFSHALVKRAALGDYRIQSAYGGSEQTLTPSAADLASAQAVIATMEAVPLYGRVDMLRAPEGNLLLMELELIEPYLYPIEGPNLGPKMASAIVRRMRPES